MSNAPIHLHLSAHQEIEGLAFQLLEIELTRPDRLIYPDDLTSLKLPPGMDPRVGTVLSGRAPIWLYTYLAHECHPTAWLACYDPRLGAIVVATHTPKVKIGQILPVLPESRRGLCPALMIVGPPDSGKSTISQQLFQSLIRINPSIYLQRAHWDGEGNWILELDPAQRETLKLTYKGALTEEFFPYHAQAILQLRKQKALVLVDIGGMVQPEKSPLLEACTHYLVVSRSPEVIEGWHQFCQDRGNLILVGVIHSNTDPENKILRHSPHLEALVGGWSAMNQPPLLPDLLDQVSNLIHSS
ncbi:MAG: CRISPR-associated protein Csx3 [Synechococcaceae cyanobacterium SM2_3_1]|nr:CRISPR-associated protein Csx3 [Synechococcaceae cyanobacterium SM2_3_1]